MEREGISIISNKKILHNSFRPAWATHSERKKNHRVFLLSTWRLLLHHLVYCCSTTSLHCFRYLSDHKCSVKDRLVWVCVLTAAVYGTYRMISDQLYHYYNNPIFYSHLAARKLIKDIPFPAVTVCSHNQIPPSAFNYSDIVLKPKDTLTEKERFQLDFANYFCSFGERRESFYEHLNVSVIEEIYQKKNDFCDEEFVELDWMRLSLIKPCSFLQQALLWHGHCYTFNMMSFERLYQPDYTYWYSSLSRPIAPLSSMAGVVKAVLGSKSSQTLVWQDDLPDTPWTTNDSSVNGGVKFTLNFRSHDFDNTCSLGDKSFSMIVHPPDEMADWNHQTHVVKDNSAVLLRVFPEVIEHSKAMEALPPSHRGCYVNGEKFLRFYQVYNQRNCELECKSNISMTYCGCVAFFHPREEDTPVCNEARSRCLIEAQQNISSKCHCLPRCSGIQYKTEKLYINKHKRIHPILDLAIVYVHYPKKGITSKMADSIVGKADVLSNLGGLLSLFLGAGVVSLLEIAYLFTLRPLVTVWNYRKQAKNHNVPMSDMWAYGAAKATCWQ